jgi:hypothetical protein
MELILSSSDLMDQKRIKMVKAKILFKNANRFQMNH